MLLLTAIGLYQVNINVNPSYVRNGSFYAQAFVWFSLRLGFNRLSLEEFNLVCTYEESLSNPQLLCNSTLQSTDAP